MNRDLSDALREWHGKWWEEKSRVRAEEVMRRVGGRMRNKELALNWAEWSRNYRNDVTTVWKNLCSKLQGEIEALELKFSLSTQVGDC